MQGTSVVNDYPALMVRSDILKPDSQTESPAVVIGFGEFGRQVLEALDRATQVRPSLPSIVGLWLGPEGWSLDWEGNTLTSEYSQADQWWQVYAKDSPMHLQSSILTALRAAAPEAVALDFYFVAHLQDDFARGLWHRVLGAVRRASIPFADYVVTMIFATDSLVFPLLPEGEASSILANLELLSSELLTSTDESEQPGRVGWCYLLDTLDSYAHPLKPIKRKNDCDQEEMGGDQHRENQSILQVHYAAEFIALLCAGLRRTPAYYRTSLVNIRRSYRGQPPAPWVSTFAAGSLTFPVSAIVERIRQHLAAGLLADYVIGHELPGVLPAAQKLRTRWLAECPLTPADLRIMIARDRSGQLIKFPIEPPGIDHLPDEELVDHLLNWDTLLWGRWNRPDAPVAQMARNADGMITKSAAWMESEVTNLLGREIGGARIGVLFVSEADKALETERHKPDLPVPAREHWFTLLLAARQPLPANPTALPNMKASHRRLETALKGRLNRRALWVRTSIFAVAFFSFLWAAYLAAGQPIQLSVQRVLENCSWRSAWLHNLPPLALDLAVLFVFCLVLVFLGGWLQLYRSEKAIHQATDRTISDIRRKYKALMERALCEERERVYDRLHANLAEWAIVIEKRQEVLSEAHRMIVDELSTEIDPAPLLTEDVILAPPLWSAFYPQISDAAFRLFAQRFLSSSERLDWRSETSTALVSNLLVFAEPQLSDWCRGIDLESWAQQPGNKILLDAQIDDLGVSLHPAWPLSREERAGTVVRIHHQTKSDRPDTVAGAMIVVNFNGLSVDNDGNPASLSILEPRSEVFSTRELGRLAYVPTIHAMNLGRLRGWDILKAEAALESASNGAEEGEDLTGVSKGNLTSVIEDIERADLSMIVDEAGGS